MEKPLMEETLGFELTQSSHSPKQCLKKKKIYRVRQRGYSLTHTARTPPAVHQGITIWVDEIEFEKK